MRNKGRREGALSSIREKSALFLAADLEAVGLSQLIWLLQRPFFKDQARIVFYFPGRVFERDDDLFNLVLVAFRRSQGIDFFGLPVQARDQHLADCIFELLVARFFEREAVFLGELFRFGFVVFVAFLADRVALLDELRLL
jgi:hypothetical protein